jgi:hypothetical protein
MHRHAPGVGAGYRPADWGWKIEGQCSQRFCRGRVKWRGREREGKREEEGEGEGEREKGGTPLGVRGKTFLGVQVDTSTGSASLSS